MLAWLKRFGLHLAAAIGATGIFVAAAAVGANQTRQQVAAINPVEVATATPRARPRPTVVVVATPAPASNQAQTQPGPTQVAPLPTSAQANPTPAPPGPTQVRPATPTVPPDDADTASDQAEPAPAAALTQPGAQLPGAQQPAAGTAPEPVVPNAPATKPNQPRRTPTVATAPAPAAAATPEKVVPERSLAGTVKNVLPNGLDVMGVGGREWLVTPAPGALIRLNGKTALLDAMHIGDTVVILGQAQPGKEGPLFRFLSHAITAHRK